MPYERAIAELESAWLSKDDDPRDRARSVEVAIDELDRLGAGYDAARARSLSAGSR
jgi:hypothetical protein